jgi:peptidoglycan-N-acetylglucosamine deacetylase
MPRVALTFDDGPTEWTEQILGLLDAHDARATFFVIGQVADSRRGLLERMAGDGHEIGNHTWSHPVLTGCDDASVRSELQRTNDVLADVLGAPPKRYRAPHFDVDERVDAIAAEIGLIHTHANVSPPDWHEGWSAALTITFVTKQVADGSIICMHDGFPPGGAHATTRQSTVDAVAAILPRLATLGLYSVTVSELLGQIAP